MPRSEVAETDLMKHVVLVRHNSYLFKGNVEENLRMAKPDATKEEMEAVVSLPVPLVADTAAGKSWADAH